MKLAILAVMLFTLGASTAVAQTTVPLKSCPLLATADAAQLTGPRVEFYSGNETTRPGAPRIVLCFFGVGEGRSLTVKTGPLIAKDAAEYRKMYEPLRQMDKASLEAGLGEYAYSGIEGGTAQITAVKGAQELSLELKGKDLAPADLEKLRAAMRKALARI